MSSINIRCIKLHLLRVQPILGICHENNLLHVIHTVFFSVASVVVATASAAKFPEALSQLSLSAPSSEALERLFNSPTKFERMDKGQDWRQMLVRKIEQISSMRAQIS